MDIQPKYGAILADPPWDFRTYSIKGTGRGAVAHYNTMRLDDIAAMNVAAYATDDCALFLWATDPMLPQAIELITSWGFSYKTVAFHWVKKNRSSDGFSVGLGYWTRANAEICLLATRGHPKRQARDVRRLIVAPRREHSRKPDEVYERIERLVPGPYLELFSRQTRAGWDAIGDQTGLFDSGTTRTRRQPSNLANFGAKRQQIPVT